MPLSGVLGQRLGGRIRLLLIVASFSVLASSAYLLLLTTESGYLDGLLPSFMARGLGIGLFMSASSLAVMGAVPVQRSGLASGMLTMSRQVGTAVGVTVLGAIYARHVDGALQSQLGALPAADASRVMEAANHFVNAAQGGAHVLVDQVILDGFIAVSVATSLMAVIAAGVSFFIRPPAPQPSTAVRAARAADAAPDAIATPVLAGADASARSSR
jgi:hypothetical protein